MIREDKKYLTIESHNIMKRMHSKDWLFLCSEINFFPYDFILFCIFLFSTMKCIALIKEENLWKCKMINLLPIFAF